MFRTSLVIKTPCKAGQEVSENKIKWFWWLAEAYNLSFCWFALVKSKRNLPALSLWHTLLLILNNSFVITQTTECCRLIPPKLFHFLQQKFDNYAKLYPLLETTAQKATPFALYCDCLYVCSLRTWILTGWALRDFALERLLSLILLLLLFRKGVCIATISSSFDQSGIRSNIKTNSEFLASSFRRLVPKWICFDFWLVLRLSA